MVTCLTMGNSAAHTTVSGSPSADSGLVGGEIRRLRKLRGLTLTQLAEKTDLSVGYLSQVERNLSSPTVKALFDISHSLGVSVNWFFDEADRVEQQEDKYIVRAERQKSIRFDAGVTDHLLNTRAVTTFELIRCTLEPGAGPEMDPYSHEGEECGYILSGQLQLTIDGVTHQLHKGDSFSFPSTLPHAYVNSGDSLTEVLWCTSPPTF